MCFVLQVRAVQQYNIRIPVSSKRPKRNQNELVKQFESDLSSSRISTAVVQVQQFSAYSAVAAGAFPIADEPLACLVGCMPLQDAPASAQHLGRFIDGLPANRRKNLGEFINVSVKAAHPRADLARAFLGYLDVDRLAAR